MTPQQQQARKQILRNRLQAEGTFATSLLLILLDQYGTEALEWHPETRWLELRDDFGAELPRINSEKLNVACDLMTSDGFFQDVTKFIIYCNVLGGTPANFQSFDPADSEECLWGVTEATFITSPEEPQPFGAEIQRYVGKVLVEEGVHQAPSMLSFAEWPGLGDISPLSLSDPASAEAEYAVRQGPTEQLDAFLKERLAQMQAEIHGLPLQSAELSR